MADQHPFYSATVNDIKGQRLDLSQFKGKPVLCVNVASKCGFTPQYKGLEELYQKYKAQGLAILGFPCNQFGAQEPGGPEEIQTFCSRTYSVTFPITEKVDVNGASEHPVYKYLKSQKKQLGMERIKWNFEKFLLDGQGKVVGRYSSVASPESIGKDVEKLLK